MKECTDGDVREREFRSVFDPRTPSHLKSPRGKFLFFLDGTPLASSLAHLCLSKDGQTPFPVCLAGVIQGYMSEHASARSIVTN